MTASASHSTPAHADDRSPSDPMTQSRWRISTRLLAVARPVIAPLGFSITARVIAMVLHVAQYATAGWVIGKIASDISTMPLLTVAIVLIVLSLLKALMRYVEQFSGHWVAFRSLALLRGYFYEHLEPQAPARTESEDSGDLLSRVTKDIDRIEVFFAHTLAPGLSALICPVIVLAYLGFAVSWWPVVALAPFLLAVSLIVPQIGVRTTSSAARTIRAARGDLSQHVTDSVQGVREVLTFSTEAERHRQMRRIEDTIDTAQRQASSIVALRRGINQSLVALALLVQAAVLVSLTRAGEVSMAQVCMALGVTLASFAPALAVEDFMADLDQAFASARRVLAITERAPLVAEPAERGVRDSDVAGTGAIEMDGVSFAYPQRADAAGPSPQVLHNVSLSIRPRSVTAIVGTSGSGKSTIARLIDRMWDPDQGTVSIDGVDVRALTRRHLRSVVAFAPQNPYVFNMSVRENLLLACPDASDSDLRRVCRQVGLDQWLDREPDGMDTRIGEMGQRISGGQRQRVALARALLAHAPITILDEATSQLDRDTETLVLNGIREATAGRTLIVIAHRISTILDADQIVVVEDGKVAGTGTYEELKDHDGPFARLLQREHEDESSAAAAGSVTKIG